jgi:hypothetical protein
MRSQMKMQISSMAAMDQSSKNAFARQLFTNEPIAAGYCSFLKLPDSDSGCSAIYVKGGLSVYFLHVADSQFNNSTCRRSYVREVGTFFPSISYHFCCYDLTIVFYWPNIS